MKFPTSFYKVICLLKVLAEFQKQTTLKNMLKYAEPYDYKKHSSVLRRLHSRWFAG